MTVNNTTQKATARRRPVKLRAYKEVNIIKFSWRTDRWELEGKAIVIKQFGHLYRCMVRFENGRNAEREIDPKAQGSKQKLQDRLDALNALKDF